ncbi:MAG: DUF447 family protein [Lautropia sp.]|nr:DUF447 family protein [Lautropia sp.]
MIHETVVTTTSPDGVVHVAPMGVTMTPQTILLKPFRPSVTLDNILASRTAVVNFTTDVRIFAGCVTGRREWETVPADTLPGARLVSCLAHSELRLVECTDDALRPQLLMRRVHEAHHAGFTGFNRAQAAVLEAAVLVSRLGMLDPAKIAAEIAYLRIAVDKTAGPEELQAWQWLLQAIEQDRPGLVSQET